MAAATSLIIALSCGPSMAAGFASKEEAIAMVKKAISQIKKQGPDKAYAEISTMGGSFHDRDLYITVIDLDAKILAHGQRQDLIGKDLIDIKRTLMASYL